MMRCCLRDMLVDEDDDLLATLIVIRSGPRSLLEEDEAMLHTDKDLLLGESYLNTYQGGLEKMFTSHGGGAGAGAESNMNYVGSNLGGCIRNRIVPILVIPDVTLPLTWALHTANSIWVIMATQSQY